MRLVAKRFIIDEKTKPYKGEMAEVLCTFDSSNSMQKVAIKLFNEGNESKLVLEAFARECESLEKLNSHPNIISLIDFGNDLDLGRKYIALDWAPYNLLEHIRSYPEHGWDGFYQKYGSKILDALTFAFSRDIIHRDVKPQNVLIDNEGAVRVADFGISKFKRYYRPGITLAQFKSAPYTPEIESEEFADTRDVYGYAVLCLECLSSHNLNTYADVYRSLDEASVPEEIEPILRRALEREPRLRQHNIVELRDELASAMRTRDARNAVRRDIPVHITHAAADILKTEFQEVSQAAARERLLRELNEVCGIDIWPATGVEEEPHLALLTAEFRFRAVIDEQKHALTIIHAARARPSQLERQRERAWLANLRFTPATPGGSPKGMDWIGAEFDVFLAERRAREATRAETELFDRWANILRLKADVEDARKAPIYFNDLQRDGNRLILSLRDRVAEDIIGEDRLIRVGDGLVIAGVVERVTEDSLVLYCGTSPDFEDLPRKGELVADTRLAEIAIKRQNFALDALRFGRSVRPELREILIGKIPVREPMPQENVPFIQDPLDDDKKAAIAVALGAPDLLVVEGPPGTGKTRFITELIAQFLREKPGARVLLSSQTHNALDHALAGIEALAHREGLSHRLVRIARRGDPRVSIALEHLLLDNGVHNWLNDAIRRSDEFLHNWALAKGISTEYVRIGLALAELRFSTVRFRRADEELGACEIAAADLRRQEAELRDHPAAGDTYRSALAELRVAEEGLQDAEEERIAARRALAAARRGAAAFPDLAGDVDTLTESDMEDLEAVFINHAPGGADFRKLLALSEEWRQRFGRSADFHGAFLAGCDVVAGTCIGVATQSLQRVEFDLCIIDEASKATPTEMLVPMTRAKKWVVVGDPKQLPPFIGEALSDQRELERYGLTREEVKHTLLDHLISIVPEHSKKSLLSQHRMIRPIGELVSHCFYGGTLNNLNDAQDDWLRKSQALPKPVTWFTTAKLPDRAETNRRNVTKNFAELRVISRLLSRLQLAALSGKKEYSVALLSGYAGQVRELQDVVSANRAALDRLHIECATVDAYQGREADVAVYSITRSNPEGRIGFLKEYERLNVALSRPKVGLAIVGDSLFCESVQGKNPFSDVLGYIRRNPTDCRLLEEVE
ncbi:AAA domain-containing protein [Methylocapsa sp. S129]|uniref:AAA domain-containing protein n=1 Tax=Methylocapsa sp. S129 TaxID=1641869 RepID=UPI00131A6804|nr:AAA domain-containing protein [Methylocapsa sp. S129]